MTRVRKRGEEIRQFILDNIESNPRDIVQVTSRKFDISRQAVSKHIKSLIKQQAILVDGTTRSRSYSLCPVKKQEKTYLLDGTLQEDIVWREDIISLLNELPNNVIDIWNYCFTEMLNNAIDHSGGEHVIVRITKTAGPSPDILMRKSYGKCAKNLIQIPARRSTPKESIRLKRLSGISNR